MTRAQKWIVTSFLALATLLVAIFFALRVSFVAQAEGGLEVFAGTEPIKPDPEEPDPEAEMLPIGQLGHFYEAQIQVVGGSGSYVWEIEDPSALPEGLTLDPDLDDLGVIRGTPMRSEPGTTICIKVTDKFDSELSGIATFTLIIAEEGWIPTISTEALSDAVIGKDYAYPIECEGHAGFANEWTISDGILPPGLILEEDDDFHGTITGTPTAEGTFVFTLRVENRIGYTEQTYTVVVDPQLNISYPAGEYSLGDTVQFESTIGNEHKPVDWGIKENRSSETTISLDGLLTIGSDEMNTYVVVYARSKTNGNNDNYLRFDFINPNAHSITVINGTVTNGLDLISGAVEGDIVRIEADVIEGKRFRNWTVESDSVILEFSDDVGETVEFPMPAGDLVITANYDTVIDMVSATFDAPGKGDRVDKTLAVGDEGYTAAIYSVQVGTDSADPDEVIYESGKEYTFFLRFVAEDGYVLASPEALTVIINGQECDSDAYDSENETWAITLAVPDEAPQQYSVTVEGGVADLTLAEEGASITVTANTPAEGYVFERWTSSDVTFENAESAVTTFTMPAKQVTVKVVWAEIVAEPEYPHSTVDGVEVYTDSLAAGTSKDLTGIFSAAKAANGNVKLTVESLEVEFDVDAVSALGGKEVSFTAFLLRTDQFGTEGAQFIIATTLSGADAQLENGKVTLSMPLAIELPEGKVAKIYAIGDNGQKTDKNASVADGQVTFETDRIASFALILEDEPVQSEGLSGGAIAGITVGSVSGGLTIAGLVMVFLHKKGLVSIKFIAKLLLKKSSLFRKKKKAKEESEE